MKRAPGISEPGLMDAGCWVLVRRSTGSLFAQETHCGNRARPGHLTCRAHAAHEADAQALKLSKTKKGAP